MTWHLDQACPAIAGRRSTPARTWAEDNLAGLARRQYDAERSPCGRCALLPVLDYLAAHNAGPGSHALICDVWHGGGVCTTCAALTRYARSRCLPEAHYYERVALLMPGQLDGDGGYRYAGELTAQALTAGESPAVTLALWEIAANLATPGSGGLRAGLAMASALGAAPART